MPSHPGAPSTPRVGSTYSLVSTAPGGAFSEKHRASSRAFSPDPAPSVRMSEKHRRTYSPGPGSLGGPSAAMSAPAASVYGGTGSSAGSSAPAPSEGPVSTLPELPPPRARAHTKGSRSETTALLGDTSAPATPAQLDSGMRFQPGLTPSDVAPVLPAGVAPLRSAATTSELARADIPPAYTAE